MTEIIKVKTGIAPELKKDIFEFDDVPCNLRVGPNFTVAHHVLKGVALKRHLL